MINKEGHQSAQAPYSFRSAVLFPPSDICSVSFMTDMCTEGQGNTKTGREQVQHHHVLTLYKDYTSALNRRRDVWRIFIMIKYDNRSVSAALGGGRKRKYSEMC